MKRKKLGRWLLLALPVPLVLLLEYISLKGQLKLSGIIIQALFFVGLECVVVFLSERIASDQRNRDDP